MIKNKKGGIRNGLLLGVIAVAISSYLYTYLLQGYGSSIFPSPESVYFIPIVAFILGMITKD